MIEWCPERATIDANALSLLEKRVDRGTEGAASEGIRQAHFSSLNNPHSTLPG